MLAHKSIVAFAVAGGLIGALVGAGIPEERVKDYEEGIKRAES